MSHVKQTAQLPPPVAAMFLERLAEQVRDEGLSLMVYQEDGDGIFRNSPYVTLSAEKPVQDVFFINLVEVLLAELKAGGGQ